MKNRVRIINDEGLVKFVPEKSAKYAKNYGFRVEDVKVKEKKEEKDDEIEVLKAKYQELTGSLPSGRMKKETLEAKIAELEQN